MHIEVCVCGGGGGGAFIYAVQITVSYIRHIMDQIT